MLTTAPIDSESWLAIESPEFSARFGRLLATTRRRSKRSIGELAASSLVGFDVSQLKQFERGSARVDEAIVAALCLLYSADIGQILPVRLPVAISEGRVSGGGIGLGFSPDDPTSLMVSYLHLIRRMRNQKKAPAIALRREDIRTIADHLDIDGAAVIERLSTLMNVTATQRNTMAMLFATGAIVIGLAAGGHAAAAAGRDPIAGIDRGATAAGLSMATRLQVPVAPPPLMVEAAPPAPNRSSCNPDPANAVMNVVIPDIDYSCPVYAGGQPMIDAGFVTLVTDAGVNPVLATRPGDPGTLWLAGHRTTHGAARLRRRAQPGRRCARHRECGQRDRHVSSRRAVVRRGSRRSRDRRLRSSNSSGDLGVDHPHDFSGNLARRLVLQTCEGEDFRWMIYADLVTG